MPDALTRLEQLEKAHKYLSGAKDVLDNAKKVHTLAKGSPKDVEALEKAVGLAKDKYAPLRAKLKGVYGDVTAIAKAGFPDIPDPTLPVKAKMEQLAKARGDQSAAMEKALDSYIKLQTKYELALRERIAYMEIVTKKCDLNIKNYTLIEQIFQGTMSALKAAFVTFPEFAANAAAAEILDIMRGGILGKPKVIAAAFKKLKKSAEAHKKEMKRKQVYAAADLKNAQQKKAKFLMEDAKEFLAELF